MPADTYTAASVLKPLYFLLFKIETQMNILKISLYTSLLLLTACQKRDDSSANPANLNIRIDKPLEGQSFFKGDTVFLSASASYTAELHGYEWILQTADSTILWRIDEHLHGSQFQIDTFWVNDRETSETLNLQLNVEVDHEGHQQSISKHFKTLKQ